MTYNHHTMKCKEIPPTSGTLLSFQKVKQSVLGFPEDLELRGH